MRYADPSRLPTDPRTPQGKPKIYHANINTLLAWRGASTPGPKGDQHNGHRHNDKEVIKRNRLNIKITKT